MDHLDVGAGPALIARINRSTVQRTTGSPARLSAIHLRRDP
jgi:hypothetical protein